MRGRYRIRTWLRGRLPGPVTWLAPKGRGDCGHHEWYCSDERTWRCYHCEAGVTHESPWTPEQQLQSTLAAIDATLHDMQARGRVRDEHELRELRRLADEARGLLAGEMDRLEQLGRELLEVDLAARPRRSRR
jgi:hypothetical protein